MEASYSPLKSGRQYAAVPKMTATLNAEWLNVYARKTHQFGTKTMTGDEALKFIQESPVQCRDERLHLMLTMSQAGDGMARRVLLQAMTPKLVSFAHSCKGLREFDDVDAFQEVCAALLVAIAKFPLRQTQQVLGNLLMRTLKIITVKNPAAEQHFTVVLQGLWTSDAQFFSDRHFVDDSPESDALVPSFLNQERDADAQRSMLKLMKLLDWARAEGTLDEEDIRQLGRYTVEDHNERVRSAAEFGYTATYYATRAFRLKKRLAKAVKAAGLSRDDF